ncbi:hypothetical protein DICPUDRAFT_31376 [Dictyostelium purpureum]|uniref:Uncharacterized protein n=1 Tax=Dictyostelium purpureum TaxID=5786 RepID=F0ZH70_DICPU|nr:uncharacterized protein DICPUDRAFT_31376 [Dictyostelium purpureum]EGC36720.1 hypothetical protein DICPUDRAFT_31376 [Dictyostelium purpureum]|eukprot:XP_003286745.1 hypothetical protein DICPUDRAFT_31376 [Dictyostelium purpureum]
MSVDQKGDIPFTKIVNNKTVDGGQWDGSSYYNDKTDKFYIFGGLNGSYPEDEANPTFSVLDLKTLVWTNLLGSDTPAPRAEAMLWGDENGKYVYLSGGRGPFRRGKDLTFNDTFAYNVMESKWYQIYQTPEQQQLANRSTEAKVVGNKAYAYAGTSSTMSSFINKPGAIQTNVIVYEDIKGWKNVTVNCDKCKDQCIPTPRGHHHLCYNKERNSLFTYGGYTKDSNGTSSFAPTNYLEDLWEFNLENSTWTQHMNSTNVTPGLRDNGKFVYCNKDVLYMIGGSDYNSKNFIDLWKYQFKTKSWEFVSASALLDENNNAIKPPTPIGSYYFSRNDAYGNHEFWIFSGASSEFQPSIFENKLWRLTVTKKNDRL